MRIRPRYIAYETLALDDNAVEYCEIIPLPVNESLKYQRDSNDGSSKEVRVKQFNFLQLFFLISLIRRNQYKGTSRQSFGIYRYFGASFLLLSAVHPNQASSSSLHISC